MKIKNKIKKAKYFILTKSIGLYINILGIFKPKEAAEKAYLIFCKPRKGKLILEDLPEILQNAKQENFQVENDFFQSYIWSGNAEIILLVHGWESNASRWKKMLPFLLETGKTIVAIDAPAHGLSDSDEFNVPKYVKVISELTKKYNPNIIIGHSIGGFASVYYQYLNQNPKLEKIVLLGAPSDLDVMFENYYDLLSLSSRVQRHFEDLVEPKINMKVEDFAVKNFVKSIDTEGLVVHDFRDFVVSLSEARKISSSWKNGKLKETMGLGHSLNDKKLFEFILQFLSKEKS